MNIYVANLSFELRDEDLKKLFVSFGEVSAARIIMDKVTDRSRGFGFVEMADETAGRQAIAKLNGAMVGGRPIKVNEAKSKSEGNADGPSERNYNNSQSFNQTIY